jgi:ANTAR domain-containing protein
MTAPGPGTVPPVRQPPAPALAAAAPPGVPARYRQATGESAMILSRAKAAYDRAQWLIKQSRELQASARVVIQSTDRRRIQLHDQASPPRRGLQRSAYLRLQARLETMPVIEQAKGILIAQYQCTQDEAFDLLRRSSQRSNVPVRELAAQLVATVQAQVISKAG